jgi:hypothetical protein
MPGSTTPGRSTRIEGWEQWRVDVGRRSGPDPVRYCWRGARDRRLGEPSRDGLREADRATLAGRAAEPGRVFGRRRAHGPVGAALSRIGRVLWKKKMRCV